MSMRPQQRYWETSVQEGNIHMVFEEMLTDLGLLSREGKKEADAELQS